MKEVTNLNATTTVIGEPVYSAVLPYASGNVEITENEGTGVRLWVNKDSIAVVTVVYKLAGDGTARSRTFAAPGYAPGRAIQLVQSGTDAGLTIEAHW